MRAATKLLAVLALSLGVFASPAAAGGWAVTTFDDLPGQFLSGKEYVLGYTIRQHGQTPVSVDKTEILAIASSGRTLAFPGKADGSIGHYVATVFFPASGTYTWRVTQGAFEAQDLGTLTVLSTAGASTDDKAKEKAAGDKAVVSDKTAAADKAAAAEKAAAGDKAAAAEKAALAEKNAGTSAVSSGSSATTSVAGASTGTTDPVRSALPFAAAAAGAMFLWRLVSMARETRRSRAAS